MAFCSNCGRLLDDSDKFCSFCGKVNSEYKDNKQTNTTDNDISVDAKVRLRGTKDAKTEVAVFVPQLDRSIRILVPNFAEEGQRIRVRGEGLYGVDGRRGDLLVNLSRIEYYDEELTTSVMLSGELNEFTKICIYLPHMQRTVQVSIPNSIKPDKTLRMKGLGKETPDGTRGDLYLYFDRVEYVHPEEKLNQTETGKQRKTVYEGEIHKCPNCGESIAAFVLKCPSCGHELRGADSSSVVHEFSKKIAQVNSYENKESLIRNFYIPNTRENIIEFFILAISNIETDEECREAWAAKLEQTYQKAKLSFGNTKEFEYLERLYQESQKLLKKKRTMKAVGRTAGVIGDGFVSAFITIGKSVVKHRWLRCVFLGAVGVLMVLIGFFVGTESGDSESPFYYLAFVGLFPIIGAFSMLMDNDKSQNDSDD